MLGNLWQKYLALPKNSRLALGMTGLAGGLLGSMVFSWMENKANSNTNTVSDKEKSGMKRENENKRPH